MKRTIITAAALAAFAAPVAAQSAAEFAIQHFNQSVESAADIRSLTPDDNTMTVSTRSNSARATAYDIFNASADSASDIRGTEGVTVVSGPPAHGAEIFARLRAESLENE